MQASTKFIDSGLHVDRLWCNFSVTWMYVDETENFILQLYGKIIHKMQSSKGWGAKF